MTGNSHATSLEIVVEIGEKSLILCQRVGLLDTPILERLLTLTDEISRMMSGLRKTLESRL